MPNSVTYWLAAIGLLAGCVSIPEPTSWSEDQLKTLKSLWIGSLPALPQSPGNPVADEPGAIRLGHQIFFDRRFSKNGEVSCATCHQPDRNFKDGLAKAQGVGMTARKTQTVVGAAYSPWLFWDGRRDSLWAQALAPMEDANEHAGNRLQFAHLIASDANYRPEYEALFGALPDLEDSKRFPNHASPLGNQQEQQAWRAMSAQDQHDSSVVFANIGRVLEAYQRRIVPDSAPFDHYVEKLLDDDAYSAAKILSKDQEAGLALFIGKAQCTHCHNGPLFTNNEFHNTGLFPVGELPTDRGRVEGAKAVQRDPFNCLGEMSGADVAECSELNFVKTHGVELVAAFRTASLRNIVGGEPFMHTGQFATLSQVLQHYNEARPTLISDELEPLDLTPQELGQIAAFLAALSGPLATPPALLQDPH